MNMNFRIVLDSEAEEMIIITEDGGLAMIRATDDPDGRTAVSEYFQTRLTSVPSNCSNVFDELAEQPIMIADWYGESYSNLSAIKKALEWLNPSIESWEMCDDLFLNFFPK